MRCDAKWMEIHRNVVRNESIQPWSAAVWRDVMHHQSNTKRYFAYFHSQFYSSDSAILPPVLMTCNFAMNVHWTSKAGAHTHTAAKWTIENIHISISMTWLLDYNFLVKSTASISEPQSMDVRRGAITLCVSGFGFYSGTRRALCPLKQPQKWILRVEDEVSFASVDISGCRNNRWLNRPIRILKKKSIELFSPVGIFDKAPTHSVLRDGTCIDNAV